MSALSGAGIGKATSPGVASGIKPKAVTMNVRQRTRNLLSELNLHYAGVALLALLNVYLLVHMAVAWQRANSQNAEAFARQEVAFKTAKIAAQPLQGLDVKLRGASGQADAFYGDRLPVSYSEVASELGVLAKRQGVRLTRVAYGENAVSGEAAGQLTEVRMDASLSGGYRPLVLFLNGLERDRTFFLVTGVTLSGQQTGVVSLRIKLVTYLRGLAYEDGPPKSGGGPVASLGSASDSGGSQ